MADDSKALPGPTPDEESRMTFTQHLGELRTRLIHSSIAVVIGFFVCYGFGEQLITILAAPLRQIQDTSTVEPSVETTNIGEVEWVTLTPIEAFLVRLKIALYASVLVAFPYILYQISGFIFPGLKPKEKRLIRVLVFGCSVLGLFGAGLAYWGVFPIVLPALMDFAPDFVNTSLRLNDTLSQIIKGIAGFAIAFQFPMILLTLVFMGILSPASLSQHRKMAILGLFVLSALLTPADPISMLMMALPLVAMYEGTILVARLITRNRKAQS